MERVNCNLCGADDTALVYRGHDRLLGIAGEFTLVSCRRCGLIYLNPRPTQNEIGVYYPPEYDPYLPAIEDEPSWFRRLDRHFRQFRQCREVMRYADRPGPMVDVGCATGVFLDGMRQRGWQVQGVELAPEAAKYARQRLGLEVFTGTLEAAGLPTASFNLVTMWDVLEHVYDPGQTLREIHRILKPGGWFVFSIPDVDCVEARWFGPYWVGWDIPRHLHLFSQNVIGRMLMENGLQIHGRSHFTGRYGALVYSLQFWLNAVVVDPDFRGLLLKLFRSLPARVLAYPYYAIADRLHQSSVVTMFAKKLGR
jgi:SAM-dependent methyltransferase